MKNAFLLLASLMFCLVARAESPNSIPDPLKTNRSWIYDGAHVLNDAEKHRIDDAINALEKKTKAQMMVVTVQTLDGMSIEEWSNAYFRRIGIGRKGENDGALFVFAMKDRKSRLEVGFGLEDRITDARATAILREQVAPAFRRGAFGEGIFDGVQVAINYIEGGGRPTPKPTSVSAGASSSSGRGASSSNGSGSAPSTYYPPPSSNSGGSSGGGGALLLFGIVAVGGVGTIVYMSTRPRRCPQCNTAMTEAQAPDSELADFEQVERHMGSRSFQRFLCPKCGFSDIQKKDTAFSGVGWCNQCHHRTARTHTRTISSATYDFGGEEEITETCEYPPCGHIERRRRSTPRLVRSTSSSSSGGFAGGFSGGSSSSSSSSGSSYDGGSSSSSGGGDSGGGGGSSSW